MKIIEIECRKYEEWDKDTQAKILDKHRDINVEYGDWADSELEWWAEKLLTMGYDVYEGRTNRNGKKYRAINIAYSGFWSQGDGASYEGYIDIAKWIETHEPVKFRRILKLIQSEAIEITQANIKRTSAHYVHERSTSVYIDWNTGDSGSKEYLRIQEIMAQLESDIIQDHVNLNREIYSDLEKCYEGMTSDESVRDTLEANEYEMDKTGKIYY